MFRTIQEELASGASPRQICVSSWVTATSFGDVHLGEAPFSAAQAEDRALPLKAPQLADPKPLPGGRTEAAWRRGPGWPRALGVPQGRQEDRETPAQGALSASAGPASGLSAAAHAAARGARHGLQRCCPQKAQAPALIALGAPHAWRLESSILQFSRNVYKSLFPLPSPVNTRPRRSAPNCGFRGWFQQWPPRPAVIGLSRKLASAWREHGSWQNSPPRPLAWVGGTSPPAAWPHLRPLLRAGTAPGPSNLWPRAGLCGVREVTSCPFHQSKSW